MKKEVIIGDQSRSALLRGVNVVGDTVRITLGPKGRNVVVDDQVDQRVVVSNEGPTVVKSMSLKDSIENMGAQLMVSVIDATRQAVGDGTTTTCILTQEMIREGIKCVAAGVNPRLLNHGIKMAVERAIELLRKEAKPIRSKRELEQIACISSKDETLGGMLAEAFSKLGSECVISIEPSQTLKSMLEFREGFSFDRGYISHTMANIPERARAEYEDVMILYLDKKLHSRNDILPILESISKMGKPLLLVVDELTDEALQIVNMNNFRGTVHIVAVEGPTHGDHRMRELEDFAALTGGYPIHAQNHLSVADITPAMYGHAAKVIVTQNETTIIGGEHDDERIKSRKASIEAERTAYPSELTTQLCEKRLERLADKVAVLRLGAISDAEYKMIKSQTENAIHAVRAALQEGITVGGGAAYAHVARALKDPESSHEDIQCGFQVVRHALTAPLSQIARNAGAEGDVVVQKVQNLPFEQGYNMLCQKYQDLMDEGVLDAVKVIRVALETAASMAEEFLSIEGAVAEKNEK